LLLPFDPNVDFRAVGRTGANLEGRFHGREGAMRLLETIEEAWANGSFEPQEVIDFGRRQLVLIHSHARGRGRDAEIEQHPAFLMIWRAGRIVRADYYLFQDQALEATGLS
jgi:ketosteroid isomerase-like protein